MNDRGPLFDRNDTPEDVATLYSWANLHGAKYRDFSEARAQTREKARLRVQQAIEEEQARAHQQAQADRTMEAQRVAEAARIEEENRQVEWAAQQAAEAAAQEALRQSELKAREAAAREAAERARVAAEQEAAEQEAARQPVRPIEPIPGPPPSRWQHPIAERFAAFVAASAQAHAAPETTPPQVPEDGPSYNSDAYQLPRAPQPPYSALPAEQQTIPTEVAQQQLKAPMPDENPTPPPPRRSWSPIDSRESANKPAWLTPERPEPAAPAPVVNKPTTDDTLQGSRERLASRWYALRGVFEGAAAAPPEAAPAVPPARAPVVAVFSLAGGVGKTSLVATLGRALSARGERVLLVDTAAYGLLPFFFGAHDQRPGVLRTFTPPGTSGDAPIQMVAVDPEGLGSETAAPDALANEIGKYSRGVSRVIVDLATASGATSRRVIKMAPLVVVPMLPDMNSVVSVSSIDSFFQHNQNGGAAGKPSLPFYVLNQFDPSLPLHLDIREVLREQLGERLLPFVLRRNPVVSEALAEGMTVMDYAPNSSLAEDFGSLAGWVKSQSAAASSAYRGVRWSER